AVPRRGRVPWGGPAALILFLTGPWLDALPFVAPGRRRGSRETLFLHHRPGIVERFAEAAHHLIDFGVADDQRRAEGNDVAGHVAQYRTVVLRAANEMRRDAAFGIEALLGCLVADKLHGADE